MLTNACLVFLCLILGLGANPLAAQTILPDTNSACLAKTQVVNLSFDGYNSSTVRQAARSGFELSGGRPVDLARWYSPRFPNLTAVFVTDIGQGVSILWGGSLGEVGPKYRLGPSGLLGVTLQRPLGRFSRVIFQLYGQYGGALRESHCIGNYGDLGGEQTVNCRLAASILPPAQTLEYLWNTAPVAQGVMKISYEFRF